MQEKKTELNHLKGAKEEIRDDKRKVRQKTRKIETV
jgi:hypothetical protein